MNGTSTPIDMNEIMVIMDNNKELVKECFNDFLDDYPEMLIRIKNAIDTGNASELNYSAHKIKGSLRYLAAHPAAEIALKLETMGKNSDFQNAGNELDNLSHACDVLKDFITRHEI